MVEDEDSVEEAELRERFRFLRERVYAVSRAFVDRVLGGVDESLAKPGEPFLTRFVVEMLNLASSVLYEGADRHLGDDDDDDKKSEKG